MPNEYSIAIHDYISDRIKRTTQKFAKANEVGHPVEVLFQQGQLDELHWMRQYLAATSDLKDFIYYEKH